MSRCSGPRFPSELLAPVFACSLTVSEVTSITQQTPSAPVTCCWPRRRVSGMQERQTCLPTALGTRFECSRRGASGCWVLMRAGPPEGRDPLPPDSPRRTRGGSCPTRRQRSARAGWPVCPASFGSPPFPGRAVRSDALPPPNEAGSDPEPGARGALLPEARGRGGRAGRGPGARGPLGAPASLLVFHQECSRSPTPSHSSPFWGHLSGSPRAALTVRRAPGPRPPSGSPAGWGAGPPRPAPTVRRGTEGCARLPFPRMRFCGRLTYLQVMNPRVHPLRRCGDAIVV